MNVEDLMLPGEVLMVLYNRARVQGMGFLRATTKPMTLDEADEIVESRMRDRLGTYFDYLHGRTMKIDVAPEVGQDLDTRLYNRDNGPEAAELALMEYMTAPKKDCTEKRNDVCVDDQHRGTECKCDHLVAHCCSHHCCCFKGKA